VSLDLEQVVGSVNVTFVLPFEDSNISWVSGFLLALLVVAEISCGFGVLQADDFPREQVPQCFFLCLLAVVDDLPLVEVG